MGDHSSIKEPLLAQTISGSGFAQKRLLNSTDHYIVGKPPAIGQPTMPNQPFVKFGPVTSELTGLICDRHAGMTRPENGRI